MRDGDDGGPVLGFCRRVEEFGRPRRPHKPKIVSSNLTPAICTLNQLHNISRYAYMSNTILIIAVLVFFVLCFIPLFIPPKITRTFVRIPPDAVTIGPDNYMHVWDDSTRINIVFRSAPHVRIRFDRRTASDFAEWLKTLQFKTLDDA